MGEYVKRSDALQAVGDVHPLDYNGQGIVERIKAIPAAEVAEVRHGQWNGGAIGWECSVCSIESNNTYPYCPYCGAVMYGGQDG